MKSFIKIFKKVKGFEILKQYGRAHVLLFSLIITVIVGFSKKSLEIVRLAVSNRIMQKLRRKYKKFIHDYKEKTENEFFKSSTYSSFVWVCWFQGMDTAPELVKVCYQSLKRHLQDSQVVLVTEENYKQYISFPAFIEKKIERGIITKTHLSDLLRLELLLQYGGTWIDATVFCSGGAIPDYILHSDLFVYQNLKPGLDGQATCISSWLMTACPNHPILELTKVMLYHYWEKHNYMIDYFLLHDFFQLAIEAYPEEWNKVMPFSNSVPHILLLRLFDEYNENWFQNVCDMTPFHKLSYKFSEEDKKKKGTYYEYLIYSYGLKK